ncbi:MAG: histidine--tRNA ligase [Actinobacteria bacterium]|nr:histidine--tRNA ligase [Actinomycetota bacterium]MCB9412438.1 histidine--tRNA ligase [Actinomycetota bacterium]
MSAGSFRAPKGVAEYVDDRAAAFDAVREALTGAAQVAGYAMLELPVFEDTALFVRGVGESTDVVSKEMFTFTDRGGRSLTLRPEGTAGALRAIIEHGLDRGQLPVKVLYSGPFFRAERPQAGRYRQFSQVGVEAVGSDDPALDAEVIAIADAGYRDLGLRRFQLLLNSLGCRECRPGYRSHLLAYLAGFDLDPATRERAELNPLRVLDDKRPELAEMIAAAPMPVDHLCEECRSHYDAVRSYLDALGVPWSEAPRLVRGLDYYTRTTFEFSHELLGAQSGIGGGGRYDGLAADLGGADVGGIGFGLGVDRTLLACEAEGLTPGDEPRIDVYGIALGEQAKPTLVATLGQLRRSGVRTDMSFGSRGLRGAMKAADRSGAPWALLIGERDLSAGALTLRNLSTGEQVQAPLDDIDEIIRRITAEGEVDNAAHP